MQTLRMTYFDGLRFLSPASAPWETQSDQAHGIYSLHFCRAGRVWWQRDDGPAHVLPAPLAWWTVPGYGYRFGAAPLEDALSSEWEQGCIVFCGPRADSMRSGGLIEADGFKAHFALLHDGDAFGRAFEELDALLSDEIAEAASASARVVARLEALLLMLREDGLSAPSLSPLEQAVSDWLEQVKIAPQGAWDVTDLAQELAISPGHLRRLTRKLAGVSPHRFVLERRLDAAARRLRTSREPIKSLAPACGFADVNGFSRLFTQRFHLPPAAYRRANRVVTLESARLKRRQNLRGFAP